MATVDSTFTVVVTPAAAVAVVDIISRKKTLITTIAAIDDEISELIIFRGRCWNSSCFCLSFSVLVSRLVGRPHFVGSTRHSEKTTALTRIRGEKCEGQVSLFSFSFHRRD